MQHDEQVKIANVIHAAMSQLSNRQFTEVQLMMHILRCISCRMLFVVDHGLTQAEQFDMMQPAFMEYCQNNTVNSPVDSTENGFRMHNLKTKTSVFTSLIDGEDTKHRIAVSNDDRELLVGTVDVTNVHSKVTSIQDFTIEIESDQFSTKFTPTANDLLATQLRDALVMYAAMNTADPVNMMRVSTLIMNEEPIYANNTNLQCDENDNLKLHVRFAIKKPGVSSQFRHISMLRNSRAGITSITRVDGDQIGKMRTRLYRRNPENALESVAV